MSWEWHPETPEEIAEHQRMRENLLKCQQNYDINSVNLESPKKQHRRSRSILLIILIILCMFYFLSKGEFSITKGCFDKYSATIDIIDFNKLPSEDVYKNCDFQENKILKTSHDFQILINTKSTCSQHGEIVKKCKSCGKIEKKTIKKVKHSYIDEDNYINANGDLCELKTCKNCNYSNEKIKEKNFVSNNGYIDNLKIESLDINIPVCYYKKCGYTAQELCDKSDCAAFFCTNDLKIICDHNYQGFNKIKKVVVNKTTLVVCGKKYICTGKIKGHNTEYHLTDENYNIIDSSWNVDLILYTCDNSWENVTITFWNEIL